MACSIGPIRGSPDTLIDTFSFRTADHYGARKPARQVGRDGIQDSWRWPVVGTAPQAQTTSSEAPVHHRG